MTHPQNIAVNADYLALVRRYAELTGISVKAAVEHAIDKTLVPELNEYDRYDDDDKVEAITKAANALLPEGWEFNVCSFLKGGKDGEPDVLIGINVGLNDLIPTYLSISEAQSLRNTLSELTRSGGKFVVGGKHLGDPFKVRRAGRGIRFELLDNTTAEPTGKFTTIAATSVPRICGALDSIIDAARTEKAKV